jgi:hypothetical protein
MGERSTGGWRRRLAALTACAVVAAPVTVLSTVVLPAPVASAAGETVYQQVTPERLADTRQPDCGCVGLGPTTIRVQIAGRAGVPADAVAAAITLTVTNTAEAGFATVYPAGGAPPTASNVNWRGGETRANGAIVQLAGGAIDVFTSSGANVIVDVSGSFVPTGATATSGRFVPLTPTRLIDTRPEPLVPADTTRRIPLPAGVPGDALAVAVNVTITETGGYGFATAYPAGAAPPNVSVVNADGPGQTRAATAIVPVTPAGLDIALTGRMDLIVDVVGYFTGAGAPASASGRFVSKAPTRIMDTRFPSLGIWTGGTREMAVAGNVNHSGVSSTWFEVDQNASAVVYNLTVVETSLPGFLTAYPARTARPETSSINWGLDQTVANLAITPMTTAGVAMYAQFETDVIVDVTGYFTGSQTAASGPAAPNASPGYQGETPQDLVRDSVPDAVWNSVWWIPMHTLPSLGGAAGRAWWPDQTVEFAYLIYENFRRNVARSVAAHEIGHILAYRWDYELGGDGNRIRALHPVDGGECLAEAIGYLLFAQRGRHNFSPGYNRFFDACATGVQARALAEEIVAATT